MSSVLTADPSTVSSVTLWWRKRNKRNLADGPSDCWWYSIDRDNYKNDNEPFPADLLSEVETLNDAVVAIAARVGVIIDPSEVVDWFPDRSARWTRGD